MSSVPPEGPQQPAPPPPPRQPAYGVPGNPLATLPMPGNAELVIYLLVVLLIGIITLAADSVGAPQFVTLLTALTFGYFISRGIAKASRVYEQ